MERIAPVLILIFALGLSERSMAQGAAVIDSLTDRLRGAAVALSVEWEDGTLQEGLGLIIGASDGRTHIATVRHLLAGNFPGQAARSITVRSTGATGEITVLEPDVVGPPEIDLAFFSFRSPEQLRIKPNVLAPVGAVPRPGDAVWTLQPHTALGWRVNPIEGRVDRRIPSRRELIVRRLPVRPTVSGAPLMTASGVIGLVVSDGTEADGSRALEIALVAEEAGRLGLPWYLTDQSQERVRIQGGRGPMGVRESDIAMFSALMEQTIDAAMLHAAQPARTVDISSFMIDATEVSWAMFEDWGRVKLPEQITRYRTSDATAVVGVTWAEADSYCRSRGGRLPTEAEWERAARGSTGRMLAWGNALPVGDVVCADCGAGAPPQGPGTVGTAAADRTPEGVMDLAGNVREWVQDWYSSSAYASAAPKNPEYTQQSDTRVVRGGSWFDPFSELVAFRRSSERPGRRDPRIGFRCAFTLPDR